MFTDSKFRRRVGTYAAMMFCMAGIATANTFHWDADVAAGDFADPAHWVEVGAPTNAANIALFNTASEHTVHFAQGWTNAQLRVGTAGDSGTEVTLDLGGNTYALTSASGIGAATALRIGDQRQATLTVTAGTLETGGFLVGRDAGGVGGLHVDGATWNSGTAAATIGYNGATGSLHVSGGAQATVGPVQMDVGTLAGSHGILTVSGSNTVLRNEHHVRLANNATASAEVRIEDHATWHIEQDLYSQSGTDSVIVDNASLYVGRFRMANGGALSTWQVINGGLLAITNSTENSWVGLGSERTQADLIIASGSRFLYDTPGNHHLYIGTVETGRLIITGDNSRLDFNSGGSLQVGRGWAEQNHGYFIVESNAVAVISNYLYIAAGGSEPNATVSITSGGTLTVASARTRIGGTTAAIPGANGTLEILSGGKVDSPLSDFVMYSITNAVLRISDGTMRQASISFREGTKFELTLHTGNNDARITSLGNARLTDSLFELSLAPGFSALPYGEEFVLIDYEGTLTGTFAGKPDDYTWKVDGYEFRINYDTTNKQVLLTTIPEPGALGLLALAGGLLYVRRRLGNRQPGPCGSKIAG